MMKEKNNAAISIYSDLRVFGVDNTNYVLVYIIEMSISICIS